MLVVAALVAGTASFGSTPAADADPAAWTAGASEGVRSSVARVPDSAPSGARLVFDYAGGAGYASMSESLPLEFPAHYEVSVTVRSSAGANPIEIKFVDASGDNVWWYRPPPGRVTGKWQTLRIRQRQIEFAWGPTADRRLAKTARVELAVHAGHGVRHGTLDVGAIRVTPVAAPPSEWPVARVPGGALAPDGTAETTWRCEGSAPCALTLDYGLLRELGGMKLAWGVDSVRSTYTVALSRDGASWRTVRRVVHATEAVDWLWFGEVEARCVRITVEARPHGVELRDARLLDVGLGADLNAFIATVAAAGRRGAFPRGFYEQAYWTLVGLDGGTETALMGEDGAVELGRGGPSLEPYVVADGQVVTWADVSSGQRLADGYLPIPTVAWQTPELSLEVSAVGHRTAAAAEGLWVRYRLTNRRAEPAHLRLALAARPFQVNPPAQFLTTPGGVSPIRHAAWNGKTLTLDRHWHVVPLKAPTAAALYRFDAQAIPGELPESHGREPATLADPMGLTSAVLAYDVELPPAGTSEVALFVPWSRNDRAATVPPTASDAAAAFESEARYWQRRLNLTRVNAAGSEEAREVTDSLRASLAHILLSRTGALLRPGTRAYARSWIRDGAMMSDALLRLGETQVPREYLRAYSTLLFPNGKVPCCVDERGPDSVPENDSPGEFIHLAAAVLRATGDEPLLRDAWPAVRAAAGYLRQLRDEERAERGAAGDAAFKGLLPPSISHEGYSAKPMHSYWDDFWGLRGLNDAVYVARRLGHPAEVADFATLGDELGRDVLASIETVAHARHLDFIPGAADLGDFDATSTTIALNPGVGTTALPLPLLNGTFDRYWQNFLARRDGRLDWHDYTPYEWRVVGSFVRLGQSERAHEALAYFLAARRPPGWRQWPEVIDRDVRHARFIGDLPHGWVASDFIRSTLDLFAFDRESDDSVVLAAGIPAEWQAAPGIDVRGLLTGAGPVSYRLVREGSRAELDVLAGSAMPAGGLVFRPGMLAPGTELRLDGEPAALTQGELRIRRVPAVVTVVSP